MDMQKPANVNSTAACMTAACMAVALTIGFAPHTAAQEKPERPAALSELIECRSITDNTERLACYDAKVAQFDQAESSGELLIAEKKVVDQAREDVFGLKAADNPLFTGKNGAQLSELSSTIKSLSSNRSGKWIFELENGSVWQQTGGKVGGRRPKVGQNIVISRGPLGSFKAVVENRPFIKVIRLR